MEKSGKLSMFWEGLAINFSSFNFQKCQKISRSEPTKMGPPLDICYVLMKWLKNQENISGIDLLILADTLHKNVSRVLDNRQKYMENC